MPIEYTLKYIMCEKKVRFPTKAKARRSIKRLPKRMKGRLNAYKCPFCDNWHIGRVDKWGRSGNVTKSFRKGENSEGEV